MKTLKTILVNSYVVLSRIFHEAWVIIYPKSYARFWYKKISHKKLNLDNPRDYNEKIQWLKLYTDISKWTDLADKYKVREYVKELGLEHILVELFGVWEKAEEIDFSLLPNRFVLKTNHGHGKVILVKDKTKLDVNKTKKQLNSWLRERYGLVSFEPHYWKIKRKIIAEELLEDKTSKLESSSLVDYKFWCLNGEPEIIMVLYDRNNITVGASKKSSVTAVRASVYDMNWNFRPDIMAGELADEPPAELPKPECFDEMVQITKILSKPFPQVRVDLYEVNKKVYLSELTFTPGGNMAYFTSEYFLKMGEKIDLSTLKRKKNKFIF